MAASQYRGNNTFLINPQYIITITCYVINTNHYPVLTLYQEFRIYVGRESIQRFIALSKHTALSCCIIFWIFLKNFGKFSTPSFAVKDSLIGADISKRRPITTKALKVYLVLATALLCSGALQSKWQLPVKAGEPTKILMKVNGMVATSIPD